MKPNRIFIAADHAGFMLKEGLKTHLVRHYQNIDIIDLGTDGEASVDYPDFAHALANGMSDATKDGYEQVRGILICGSGIGIGMAANRHAHIRAASCYDDDMARLSRQHNDANVIVFGARFTQESQAISCLDIFLTTPFEAGRHKTRVQKISI